MFLPQIQQEPKEHRYTGDVRYCEICDGKIEVDSHEWAGRYQYIQTLGYVCDGSVDCMKEQALEILRRGL